MIAFGRETQFGGMTSIEIEISQTMLDRIRAAAKKASIPHKVYCRLLFEAAWTARCAKSNDPELEAAVEATFGTYAKGQASTTTGPAARLAKMPLPPEPKVHIPAVVAKVEPRPAPPSPTPGEFQKMLLKEMPAKGDPIELPKDSPPVDEAPPKKRPLLPKTRPVPEWDQDKPKPDYPPLTEAEVKLVKALRATGRLANQIAKETGLNVEAIRDVFYPQRTRVPK